MEDLPVWQQVLGAIIAGLVTLLGTFSPFIIKWLKTQKWIQKAHLENIAVLLIPQIIEWVEYWALQLPTAPSGEEKFIKAMEFAKKHLPGLDNDEGLKLRIETALLKGLNKDKKEVTDAG